MKEDAGGAGGGEDEMGDVQVGSELVGPAEEEVGDDGERRDRMGLCPLKNDGVVKLTHADDDGDEPV